MTPDSQLSDLWHRGTTRCALTRPISGPPFVVALFDGDTLVSLRVFDDHDAATIYALDALRVASQPAS